MLIEVCIDSIRSLEIAQQAGAQRIELCSALISGGLTPSAGYMAQAAKIARVPVYSMIRAREGDFNYSSAEVELMLADIYQAKQARLQGIVIGALTPEGLVDQSIIKAMLSEAKGMGVTFHRAIDHCRDPFACLDFLLTQGVERVLTSGGASSAIAGIETIKQMHDYCGSRLSIMPGAGINPDNAKVIATHTKATELHLSAKQQQASSMQYRNQEASMGSQDDFQFTVTNPVWVKEVIRALA